MKYEIKIEDYLGAQRLHSRWRSRDIKIRNILWALTITTAIVLAVFSKYILVAGMIGAIVGSFLVPFIWNNTASPLIAKGAYKKLSAPQKHQEIEITENGIAYGNARENIEWSRFEKWKESEGYILVYLDSKRFLIIPKRIDLNGVFIQELEECLIGNVKKSD